MQFRASRTAGGFYQDRDKYLEVYANVNVGDRWLCHCIAATKGGFEEPGWPTLVLGSGCLEALDAEDRFAMSTLPEAVVGYLERQYPGADEWFDGDASGALRRYVRYLVRDRVDPKYQSTNGSEERTETSDVAVDLVIYTAILTSLYHRVKSYDVTAVTRSGDEIASTDVRSVWWNPLYNTLIEPAFHISTSLKRHLSNRGVDQLIRDVLDAIHSTLTPAPGEVARLALWHLNLLTECSWYYLTQGTSVYPGWADLLLTLAVRRNVFDSKDLDILDSDGAQRVRTGLPRPAFANPTQAAEAVQQIFLPTTVVSWDKSEASPGLSERSLLYATCAALLQAQAKARASETTSVLPPVASAFVTTFDLELEMALLRSVDKSPYLVALPFNVLVGSVDDRSSATSHPIWLGHVVRPDVDGLESLLRPTEWIVLREEMFGDAIPAERGGKPYPLDYEQRHLRYGNLPIIVRLSGCPLVAPPPVCDHSGGTWLPFVDELAKVLPEQFLTGLGNPTGNADDPGLILEHAIVLDEYAAMQQTATELFTPGPNSRIGLPSALAAGADRRPRFWMLLGVQVGDPGMRHRVAFQISAPELTSSAPLQAPKRAGMVVNRRMSSEDQDLLHWFGFDVIQGRCQDFIQDLERLVAHVRARRWHACDRTCEVMA
jgi:hypothetical protein